MLLQIALMFTIQRNTFTGFELFGKRLMLETSNVNVNIVCILRFIKFMYGKGQCFVHEEIQVSV